MQRYEKFSYPCTILLLILEINALYSVADACKHLVRDGVEDIRQYGDGKVVAEYLNAVTLVAVYSRDVYHGHVHTDIAYILCLLSVDKTEGMTVAQTAVQAIGIADRDGSDDAVLVQNRLAAITHALTSLDVVHLQDGGLQRAHAVDSLIVARVDAIESQS